MKNYAVLQTVNNDTRIYIETDSLLTAEVERDRLTEERDSNVERFDVAGWDGEEYIPIEY